ncbi:hypothetical protein Q9233_016140 [Columba guinea]|nr:hypothetical protein Q9233_016140 [Columba guinea]
MAVDHFLSEKIWFDKYKYDDAERRYYEQMNGPVGGSSQQQENGASTILRDIARARENIQKSLAGSTNTTSPGPPGDQNDLLSRISHLEVENQNLRSVVADLQMAIFKLESRLNALEKSSTSHQPAAVPPTQVSLDKVLLLFRLPSQSATSFPGPRGWLKMERCS